VLFMSLCVCLHIFKKCFPPMLFSDPNSCVIQTNPLVSSPAQPLGKESHTELRLVWIKNINSCSQRFLISTLWFSIKYIRTVLRAPKGKPSAKLTFCSVWAADIIPACSELFYCPSNCRTNPQFNILISL